MSFTILSIGRDPVLLKTRRSALLTAGYATESVASITGAIERILQGSFDLILLCTSLREEERLRLVSVCRRHMPFTPILIVSEDGASIPAAGIQVMPALQHQIAVAVAEALPKAESYAS
jgi:CheY-like chemotaxis protein